MNRKEIFNHFSILLNDMIDNSSFLKYYFQEPFYLRDGEKSFEETCNIYSGATRGCLVDKNFSYVVKFNLMDEESGLFYTSCQKEQCIYSAAEKENLQDSLLKPVFIGNFRKTFEFYNFTDINDFLYDEGEEDLVNCYFDDFEKFEGLPLEIINIEIPLYAYPRAERIDANFYGSKDSCITAKNSVGPLSEYADTVGAKIIDDYGEDYFFALQDFLESFEVNDLHSGNIMRLNEKVVISDYAGYSY